MAALSRLAVLYAKCSERPEFALGDPDRFRPKF